MKLLWAILNLKKPELGSINKIKLQGRARKKILFVAIDYEKFALRRTKKVKNITYECGVGSLKNTIEFCIAKKFDFIKIVAADDLSCKTEDICVNEECRVLNGGTDIASLKKIEKILLDYETVIVVNSSCAYVDSLNIGALLDVVVNETDKPFVAGFNANSRISPRLPFSGEKYPHIITNIFAARSIEICEILRSEDVFKNKVLDSGFGNKYFAIRYFETLLSSWVLHKGGRLVLLGENNIVFESSNNNWPKKDTRLLRFLETSSDQ